MPKPEAPETPPIETPSGQEPAVEGQQPVIESPTLSEEPVETPPESELSPEDKILHKLQSWAGRRDAELRAEIQQREQALLETIRGMTPSSQAGQPQEEAPDPTMDADKWFDYKLQQRVSREMEFNKKVITAGTQIVQQDELVKTDPKLANEIYDEVQSGRVILNRNLPAEEAAQVAVAQAKANVLTKRFLSKATPLGQNKGIQQPVGGITPPPSQRKPAVKVPEMSDLAKDAAKRWGFTEEEVAETLKD